MSFEYYDIEKAKNELAVEMHRETIREIKSTGEIENLNRLDVENLTDEDLKIYDDIKEGRIIDPNDSTFTSYRNKIECGLRKLAEDGDPGAQIMEQRMYFVSFLCSSVLPIRQLEEFRKNKR